MADDNNKPVNNSNKPINGRSKIERIQVRREDALGEYTERQAELEAAIEREESKFRDLEAQYAKTSDKASRVAINAKLVAQAERYTQAEERYSQYESSHAQKVNAQAAQEIATYAKYENINARTTTMSGSQRYFSQIQQDIRQGGELIQTPTEAIEQRIRSNQQQAARLGRELAGQTRGLGYDEWTDEMRNKDRRLQQLQEDTALDKRLIKVQIKEGMTTEKRQYAAKEVMGRAGRLLGEKELAEDVREGRYGDLQSETERLSKLFEKLSQAAEKFESASQNATDAQGNLTEEYKQASKALDGLQKATDKQRQVVSEIERQGGGGGPGGLLNKYAPYLAAGKALSSASSATYQIAGSQDIEQMRNRSRFAAIGNDRYFKATSAVYNNDIDAMLELATSPALEKAYADRNRTMRHGTAGVSSILDIVTGTLESTLKGAAIGGGTGAIIGGIGAVPGAVIGGGAGLISGLSSTLPNLTNLAYGNTGAAASLESYETMKSLNSEERKIRSFQMQSFYNQGLNLYNNTAGLGEAGLNIQDQLLNNDTTLGKLAGTGVSASISANLITQLRSAGNISGNDAISSLLGAGKAMQRGQLARAEYMDLSSQFIAAGGGPDQLESIITAATAKGMDNSRNIQQMAAGTLQLSSRMANIGVAGTGAIENMLSANIQSLVSSGVNPNLAVGMATNDISNYDKSISDTGFNLGNIAERQSLRMRFGNASVFQLNAMSSMTSGEHAVLRAAASGDAKAQKEANNLIRRKGLGDVLLDQSGNIKAGDIKALTSSALMGSLLNVGAADQIRPIQNKLDTDQTLSPKEASILNQAGYGQNTAKAAQGLGNVDRKEREIQNRPGLLRDILASNREGAELISGRKAAKELGPGDAFSNIEKLMSTVSEAVSPEKYANITKEAAEKFEIPVADFGKHVKKFDSAINMLINQQNRMLEKMGEKRGEDWVPSKKK